MKPTRPTVEQVKEDTLEYMRKYIEHMEPGDKVILERHRWRDPGSRLFTITSKEHK